jgi:hypothetical protein
MERLISICFLVFLTVMCNAQEKNKSKYSELNHDQLNLALTKSKKTIIAGKVLTYSGLGLAITGTTILIIEGAKALEGDASENTASAGVYVLIIGGAILWTGVPVLIVGTSKKHKIEFELAKFKNPGSASINGIGLKIRF